MPTLITRRRALAATAAGAAAAVAAPALGQSGPVEAAPLARRVTVLHIGDSHIASDAFSRGIRSRLQAAFGDAGRGSVIPAGAFGRARADRTTMTADRDWTFHNSLDSSSTGPFGVSGMRLESRTFGAQMRIEFDHDVDEIEVVFASGPSTGQAWIGYGDDNSFIDTAAERNGPGLYSSFGAGRSISVAQIDELPISVSRWGAWRRRPGVVYMNFGIPGARASLHQRWSRDALRVDVASIEPDYVVLGYGTNEALDVGLDLARHRAAFDALVREIRLAAPAAKLVFITPPGVARPPGAVRAAHDISDGPCGPSPIADLAEYAAAARAGDERLAVRHEPPMAAAVRGLIEDAASEAGGLLWRWEAAMGGPCAIDVWAKTDPPLAQSDRIHLTSAGYDRSAASFADFLATAIRDDFF